MRVVKLAAVDIRMALRMPTPPRYFPAPPESFTSENSSFTIGDFTSLASTGEFAGVVVTAHLPADLTQIDRHVLGFDDHPHVERYRLAVGDAVVVHERLGLIDAVRNGRDAGPGQALALLVDALDTRDHGVP